MQDKSTYEIKQWSLEEIQKFHKENPFVIVEDEIAMIGFYPTKEIAQMSGGEYTTFTGDQRFQQRVVDAAKHMRNRYLITFSPSDPWPGLHTIRIRTTQDYGARIIARANYWAASRP